MLDLAASRVLELGIGDVLDLDLSWLGIDDAAISAHGKPPLQCDQKN
jgi:flagellar motor switch protein FliM